MLWPTSCAIARLLSASISVGTMTCSTYCCISMGWRPSTVCAGMARLMSTAFVVNTPVLGCCICCCCVQGLPVGCWVCQGCAKGVVCCCAKGVVCCCQGELNGCCCHWV